MFLNDHKKTVFRCTHAFLTSVVVDLLIIVASIVGRFCVCFMFHVLLCSAL